MSEPTWSGALRQAVLLAVLAVLPAAGAWSFRAKASTPASRVMVAADADGMIAPAAAVALGNRVLWVDARRREEFNRGRLPYAVLLNEDEWDALLPEVLQTWTPQRTAIVYCDGGACQASKQVAARLRDAGIAPVYVLRGGYPEWVKEVGAPGK